MYRKNTASQFVTFAAVKAADGTALTGATVSVRRCIDGTFAAATGTVTEDANGYYKFALSQADTNGNNIGLFFTATSMVPICINIVTTAADPTDSVRFGLTALPNAAAAASGGLWILGSNNTAAITIGAVTVGAISGTTLTLSGAVAFQSTFAVTGTTTFAAIAGTTLTLSGAVAFQSTFAVTGTVTYNAFTVTNATTLSGAVSMGSTFSTTGTVTFNAFTVTNALTISGATTFTGAIAGTNASNDLRVNVVAFGGTAGTFASGRPEVNTTHIAGTISPATAGYVGIDWSKVNAPTSTVGLSGTTIGVVTLTGTLTTYTGNTVQTGDSYARIGAAGAGLTNITLPSGALANVTAWTVAITGNITGNLSGSVASVTGNLGGNVVGNVNGSVASIATGGIAATTFAAGAIDAAAIAADAIGSSELAASAATEIAAAVIAAEGTVTGTVAASPAPATSGFDVTLTVDRATGFFDRSWCGLTSGAGNATWRRITTHTRVSATVARFAFSGSASDPDGPLAASAVPTAADTVTITGRG